MFNKRAVIILSAVFLAEAAAFYGFSRTETVALNQPLDGLPTVLGSWRMLNEGVIEQEILDVLKADDVLNRNYAHTENGSFVNLFVAYFKTQRTGQAPHSPRNCLPGSGWVQNSYEVIQIPIEGRSPIEVNRYIVAKGEAQSLVLYWYQSRDRVVADEYRAKFFVIADALRYNRTDTALVRVVTPVQGRDVKSASAAAIDFVRAVFNPLRARLPA
jgi:EpsI family protein